MRPDIKIPEDISLLIVDFFQEKIDEDGLSKLNAWLQESNENIHRFNSLKSVWLTSGKPVGFTSEKIDQTLAKVKSKNQSEIEIKPDYFWSFRKIAASWLLFIIAGGALGAILFGGRSGEKSSLTTITAPLGSKSIVDLPDGTKVWINAGSQLTYTNNYGKLNREVKLVGEAYFNVRTNPAIPFIVKTSDISVKALGTRFNVKAYPDEKTITTTLEEGKIQVTMLHKKSDHKMVELKPKDMITYIKAPGTVNKREEKPVIQPEVITEGGVLSDIVPEVKTELQTSWKDNTWIIEGQPLEELIPLLERRYNVIISFDKSEIKDLKFTSKIQNETIEQILMALELSSPIKFSISNNNITIHLNNSLLEKYSKNTNQ